MKWIHFQLRYPMENHCWISNIVRLKLKVSRGNQRDSKLFSLCIEVKIYWVKIFKIILSNMNLDRIMKMPIGIRSHIVKFISISMWYTYLFIMLCVYFYAWISKEIGIYVCFVKPASHWILINLTYLLEFSLFS